MKNQLVLGGVVAVLFVAGIGYITYQGRPVMDLREEEQEGTDLSMADANTNEEATETQENEESEGSTEGNGGNAVTPGGTTTPPDTTITETTKPGTYSMTDVEKHNLKDNCWSAINGSVYDLTSFVERHPGGPQAIVGLCGTDGSTKFNRQHGSFQPAQASLALLKIGALN